MRVHGRDAVWAGALVLALAATGSASYAAGTLITSKQIKNGTIQIKDLSPAAVAGLKGKTGPQGLTGPTGPTGPSNAYSAYRDGISPPPLPANADTTVVTLQIPQAGSYVINGKVGFDEISGASHVETCHLRAGGDSDLEYVTTPGAVGGWGCALQVVHTFAAPGTVTLSIETAAGTTVRAGQGKVTAIKVGSLVNTGVTG